jgi:hypothetical protein
MKQGGVTITGIRKGMRRAQRCVEWSRSGLVVRGTVSVALPEEFRSAGMSRIRNWLACWMVEQGVPREVAVLAKWHARECTRMERLTLNGEVLSAKQA